MSLPTRTSALLTDSYELMMAQAYLDARMDRTAVFEFFVRRLPDNRNFLLATGLEQFLDYLEALSFNEDELRWLQEIYSFTPEFIEYLRTFRFSGDIDAVREGTPVFRDEPIVRVTAPIIEAQLIETRLINLLQFQTLIASKAVRSVLAAPDTPLIDFGMRRAHGAEAALLSSRASYLAGFTGTSNLLAGMDFGIPTSGTMAHSFIEAHSSELQAFEHFSESMKSNLTLLIDTYQTEHAAENLISLIPKLKKRGFQIRAVRIDSGDLLFHARAVRGILDRAGLSEIRVFASGGLEETQIAELVRARAPIDGYGVGTQMDTSSDAAYLDCAYKLQEYDEKPKRKTSEGKATWPGRKQVYRTKDAVGVYASDILALEAERYTRMPLLAPVMRGGKRLAPSPRLEIVRTEVRAHLKALPPRLRSLEPCEPYPVIISPAVRALAEEADRQAAA